MHNIARSFPLSTNYTRTKAPSRARSAISAGDCTHPTTPQQNAAKQGLADLFGQSLRRKLADCGFGVEVFEYPVPVTYRKHRRVCTAVSA